ncbi:MAG: hypothetical protein P8K77_04125 [Polaribacter sp.]|nr:hypothetical protein [Polaribacter sp.]
MKKTLLLVLILCHSLALFAQENNSIPRKQTQKGFLTIDYASVKMPTDKFADPENNMGLAGVHYNLWLNKSIYGGLGFYGSIHGKRGGLFTLGANLGIKKKLFEQLFLDTGFHIGGGGGASAPDGGGAFIMPHANLGYQFKTFTAFAGYSAINFFDKGNINSQQLNIGLQIPVSFDHTSFASKEKTHAFNTLKTTDWNQTSNRISLLFHLNNLSVIGNSQNIGGSTLVGNTIRLAGFELNAHINNNWFAFFRADGAYHGIPAGYMDILLGGGYHFSFNNNSTHIISKFGVGAGGGGGVDTQGGFLISPDISLEQKIHKGLHISINKGYLLTPNSHFIASTYGIGLKYYAHTNGILSKENTVFTKVKLKGIQITIQQEMYFNAKRESNPTENLQQISLQGNLFLNRYMYVAGQTSFANFGNAGAYAEGIVGLGINSNPIFHKKITAFAQLLGGAAGGGDISTGQGLIIKPSIGFNYELNDKLSIRTSVGKATAKGGKLNSTSVAFGLSYNISFLTAN